MATDMIIVQAPNSLYILNTGERHVWVRGSRVHSNWPPDIQERCLELWGSDAGDADRQEGDGQEPAQVGTEAPGVGEAPHLRPAQAPQRDRPATGGALPHQGGHEVRHHRHQLPGEAAQGASQDERGRGGVAKGAGDDVHVGKPRNNCAGHG